MKRQQALAQLRRLWRTHVDIGRASALLGWDQETVMPAKGAANRAALLETLGGLAHEKLTCPEMGEVLARLAELEGELDPLEYAMVREARRAHDKAVRTPRELVERLAKASAEGLEAWKAARAESAFERFRPALEHVIDLRREEAECQRTPEQAETYDALLDQYEPGLTAERTAALFDELAGPLTDLVGRIAESKHRVDTSPLRGRLPRAGQEAFGREVLETMGFDFAAGRIDLSAHPFCSSNSPGDVRLTWRYSEEDLRPALYGLIHEAGHGLYEQGLDPDLERTPVGPATSLGVHESQSRLWENLVGRSLAFWEAFAPSLARHLPDRDGGDHPEALFLAANEVRPSLIRIEADEVTYNLHIILRFTLERGLIRRELDPADLPAAWNDGMERLLGLRPERDADGVLQDIHWAFGYLGYFPTYTLGNLYGAHLYQAAAGDLGDLEDRIRHRDWAPLREWLGEKIHRHGSVLPAEKLIEAATGTPPTAAALLAHLERRVDQVYGV